MVLGLVFWRPILLKVGSYLVVDEPPVESDLVVVSGGDVDRILYGVELVRKGVAPRLLVLLNPKDCPRFWDFDCKEQVRKHLLGMGFSAEQVLLEARPHSTYTDAVFARQRMESAGLRSAVVVSEPFHMRRVALSWRRVFSGSGIRLTFSAIPFEKAGLALEGWWTREKELVFVFMEYVKLALYWAKGYI